MTKSSIISYITARWGDITSPKRLPILDREVSNALLNAFYPTTQTETQSTGVITTSNSNFNYVINFTKVGRLVHVTGNANNISGVILSAGTDVFAFNDTEFKPNLALNQVFDNRYIFEISLTNTLQSFSAIPVNASIYFNFTYSTQD